MKITNKKFYNFKIKEKFNENFQFNQMLGLPPKKYLFNIFILTTTNALLIYGVRD